MLCNNKDTWSFYHVKSFDEMDNEAQFAACSVSSSLRSVTHWLRLLRLSLCCVCVSACCVCVVVSSSRLLLHVAASFAAAGGRAAGRPA